MGDGPHRESLEFENAKIVKDKIRQDLHFSVERSNGEQGDSLATLWETKEWSDINFAYTTVTIHNADAWDAETRKHDEQNEERKFRDLVRINRSFGLDAHVALPSERFSRILQINWKEQRLKLFLTLNADPYSEGLKFPLSESDKGNYRKSATHLPDPDNELGFLIIDIYGYNLFIEVVTDQVPTEPE